MSDDLLREARDLLAGVTPGQWFEVGGQVWPDDESDFLIAQPEGPRGVSDARLIAAAPRLVARLIAEVERLCDERDALAQRLARVEPILSLLHHRGLVDSQNNRDDVKDALAVVRGEGQR